MGGGILNWLNLYTSHTTTTVGSTVFFNYFKWYSFQTETGILTGGTGGIDGEPELEGNGVCQLLHRINDGKSCRESTGPDF